MNINIEKTINVSAEKAWKTFAHDFDNAHEWMASIPSSYGENLGVKFEGSRSAGRVCELDTKKMGIKAVETIEAYNEAEKTIQIRIDFRNTPKLFPIKFNVATFKFITTGNDSCRIVFKVKIKLSLMGYMMYPLVRLGFPSAIGQMLEELYYFTKNGTPHPRKIKAIEKLKLAQLNS
jgi:hypothetical protein